MLALVSRMHVTVFENLVSFGTCLMFIICNFDHHPVRFRRSLRVSRRRAVAFGHIKALCVSCCARNGFRWKGCLGFSVHSLRQRLQDFTVSLCSGSTGIFNIPVERRGLLHLNLKAKRFQFL